MDNQHRLIKGYTELTADQITTMNAITQLGSELDKMLCKLQSGDCDQRWLSIGKTNLQQGLMALKRAVTRPDIF